MHTAIVPETFTGFLVAFEGCFSAPSYRTFVTLVTGWVQCLGRRTVTAMVIAADAVGTRHISAFHRFFSRAHWMLDELGRVVFHLALPSLPAEGPLIVISDDTLCRKGGKGICGASMHHDPLRSSARKPFFSFGHVWVVLALWVPLPMGGTRGFALPILFRLSRSTKRGGRADAPSRPTRGQRLQAAETAHTAGPRRTKLELAREMLAIIAPWAGPRSVYAVADSLYAGRPLLEQRPPNVHVISRLRLDAALWTPPPPRQKGQTGRPRRRGVRLPTPTALAAACRRWQTIPVTLYGRDLAPRVFVCRALWYVALRDHPVRIVVVRDPTGKRKDEAFFCTDAALDAASILELYARRWTLAVTFHDAKQYLGFEDAQSQTAQAVLRTAPLAGIVYALSLLWAASRLQRGCALPVVVRPWYRTKATPSFLDMLVALRQDEGRRHLSRPPSLARRTQHSCPRCQHSLLAAA
jgi:DDE superfamily endonuclease